MCKYYPISTFLISTLRYLNIVISVDCIDGQGQTCCEAGTLLLTQHSIIDENENVDIYRFWNHTFSNKELREILLESGFATSECYDQIIPGCDMYRSEDVTFCIANK